MKLGNKIEVNARTNIISINHKTGRIVTKEDPEFWSKYPRVRIYDLMPNFVIEEIDQFVRRENWDADFSSNQTIYRRLQ